MQILEFQHWPLAVKGQICSEVFLLGSQGFLWVCSHKVALEYTKTFSYIDFLAGFLGIMFFLEKHILTQRIASHMGGFPFWDKLHTAISVSSASVTL